MKMLSALLSSLFAVFARSLQRNGVRTMTRLLFLIATTAILVNQDVFGQTEMSLQSVISQSRNQCVRIYVPEKEAWGSGFFLDERFVVTSFHVIGGIDSSGASAQIRPASEIRVICPDGQEIAAECRSIPSRLDMAPVLYDFAILWLEEKPKTVVVPAVLPRREAVPAIGTPVVFSAFSLDVPAILTHRGYLSATAADGNILCVQAPISTGMSGAALYAVDGSIVGMMNARESHLPQKLVEIARKGYALKPSSEVNTHSLMLDLVESLGLYGTHGVAYATTTRRLAEYLDRHPRDEP
jgi:S1-C subfamily serine protease